VDHLGLEQAVDRAGKRIVTTVADAADGWLVWLRPLGAAVPIILTSRADSLRTRLASCAVASIAAHHVAAQDAVAAFDAWNAVAELAAQQVITDLASPTVGHVLASPYYDPIGAR
jgi:hypothetical protein